MPESLYSMIRITERAILFCTWITLATCIPSDQPTNTSDIYKSILSQKEIFYNPVSKLPVPPLNESDSTSLKNRDSKKVFGSLPCTCEANICTCCVDIKIHILNSEDNGCIRISPSLKDDSMMDTTIFLNNQSVVEQRVSFDDPSPLCSPFPRLPLISGCVKFNRIRTDKGHLRGCAKLEVRVTGTDAILWDMQFSCFKIGTDGIMFSNPNKNKDKPKPVKESIKEPVKKPMKKPNGECH